LVFFTAVVFFIGSIYLAPPPAASDRSLASNQTAATDGGRLLLFEVSNSGSKQVEREFEPLCGLVMHASSENLKSSKHIDLSGDFEACRETGIRTGQTNSVLAPHIWFTLSPSTQLRPMSHENEFSS
jgi:hypothetical protein